MDGEKPRACRDGGTLVPYFWPYFGGISPDIGLMVGSSNQSLPEMVIETIQTMDGEQPMRFRNMMNSASPNIYVDLPGKATFLSGKTMVFLLGVSSHES